MYAEENPLRRASVRHTAAKATSLIAALLLSSESPARKLSVIRDGTRRDETRWDDTPIDSDCAARLPLPSQCCTSQGRVHSTCTVFDASAFTRSLYNVLQITVQYVPGINESAATEIEDQQRNNDTEVCGANRFDSRERSCRCEAREPTRRSIRCTIESAAMRLAEALRFAAIRLAPESVRRDAMRAQATRSQRNFLTEAMRGAWRCDAMRSSLSTATSKPRLSSRGGLDKGKSLVPFILGPRENCRVTDWQRCFARYTHTYTHSSSCFCILASEYKYFGP